MTLIGAGLLWFGWFGFNAGSSAASDLSTPLLLRKLRGALWMILEGLLHKKVTALGFVSGVLAGLVAITPAAGLQPLGCLVLFHPSCAI